MSIEKNKKKSGQILTEILIAIAVAGIIIGGIAATIGTGLITSKKTKQITVANGLAQELIEAVKAIGQGSWQSIYCPPSGSCPGSKGEGVEYSTVLSSGSWQLQLDRATTTIDGLDYGYYFYIENVNRDEAGNITDSGGAEDPSTQKISIFVNWTGGGDDFSIFEYITRTNILTFSDSNWSSNKINDGPYTYSSGYYSSSTGGIIIQNGQIQLTD